MTKEVFCDAEGFDDVLKQTGVGMTVVGVSLDDFLSISVAAALGERAELRNLLATVKRLKVGLGVGMEQTAPKR
jgi:hypothetical protein